MYIIIIIIIIIILKFGHCCVTVYYIYKVTINYVYAHAMKVL